MTAATARAPAEPLPRASLFTAAVALLALVVWWPIDPYWQSDDFLAVTYAHDARRAWSDFAGAQYSAPALVVFYRPLITLSFAFDGWVAGAAPMWSHLSNVLAHATSTLLLTLLARRTLGDRPGLCLGLLWAVWPTHAGSILWAVGRVDSHTSVWIMLSAYATTRWLLGQRGRILALVAFGLALLSKELAFVVPGLAALLGFALAPAPARARVRSAWRACWPFLIVFAVYLAWRYVTLGQVVGGYAGAHVAPAPALRGLATWCARVCSPWPDAPPGLRAATLALWPLALILAARRGRVAGAAFGVACFAVCAIPTAPFWAEIAEIKNVRYFYLPLAGLLGTVALAGRWPTSLALALVAAPLWQVRQHYVVAHRAAARQHAQIRAADAARPPGCLLVHGLPREDASHQVLMFHLFVDRLLLPPFGGGRSVLALRPLIPRPGVEQVPLARFVGLDGYLPLDVADEPLPAAPDDPDLRVEIDGDLHLSSAAIWDMHRGRTRHGLRFVGDRSTHYRLSILTAGGYIACVLPNETHDAGDGYVSMATLLGKGRYAREGDDAMVALALQVPATLDVSTDFPVLVEAGTLASDGHTFAPRARTQRPLRLRLDRDYADWLAGKVGDPRAQVR